MHSTEPSRRMRRDGRDRIVVASNRRSNSTCRNCPVYLAAIQESRYSWAGWATLEQGAGHRGLRDGEPAVPATTCSAGQTDLVFASGPGSSRWDRIVARFARNRPTSEAIRDATESLADHLAHYNQTRKMMGQPPITSDDLDRHFMEIALTPQERHDRDERMEQPH